MDGPTDGSRVGRGCMMARGYSKETNLEHGVGIPRLRGLGQERARLDLVLSRHPIPGKVEQGKLILSPGMPLVGCYRQERCRLLEALILRMAQEIAHACPGGAEISIFKG
jgi:hypothetical protein